MIDTEEIRYTGRVRKSTWRYTNDNKQVNKIKQPTEYHPSNRYTAAIYMTGRKTQPKPQNTFQMTYTVALHIWPVENQAKARITPFNNNNPKDTWTNLKPQSIPPARGGSSTRWMLLTAVSKEYTKLRPEAYLHRHRAQPQATQGGPDLGYLHRR